ncbi:MAG: 23S rRNA (adenine(2030)-N(6))-methyltransferase RlmJ [Spirochaetaceae bacterium]|jgi:23S rRNA (adenine2030-N6)-methyltransferase|nr:23S rRNA (adenine(2030)-N(6))-methyltransferase RlmJ [Spirochaetaceae bacterium]
MLSYRHAFHAGNAADVVKHTVLAFCLDYLAKKETAFAYIDTHAGAGAYNLEEGYASQNREWESGVSLVLKKFPGNAPLAGRPRDTDGGENSPLMAPYLACLKTGFGALRYPGSPLIAKGLLRKQDRAHCFELHPADFAALDHTLKGDTRFSVQCEDGLSALKGLLPPPQKRGLIFIDPSYEIKDDYTKIPLVLEECLRRFPGGLYLLWFPLLRQDSPGAAASRNLDLGLPGLDTKRRCILSVQQKGDRLGRGLYGSALFIINPPWTLKAALDRELPALASLLGLDRDVRWEEHRVAK